MPIMPRPFLLALALVMLALAAWRAAGQTRQANASKKSQPNIIFILADDLGYGDLGVYGQGKIKTPNIDRLAADGTRFTSVYAGHAVCAPSRNVLMTGQHTGHATIRNNSGQNAPKHDGQEGRIPLHVDDFTVAQLLKDAGYRTGIAGKWGLGEPGSTGLPNDHGFDEWLGYLNQDHAPDYYTDFLWHNKEKQPIPENANGAREIYSCDIFADFAEAFIRQEAGHPFFLYLPFTIPHAKIEVPELGRYSDEGWSKEEKTLAAMITRLDSYVGRITTLLKNLELDESTIIFFASDNGASATSLDFFNRSGPLRAQKGSLYEGGLRTPAIVRWPGKVPADVVSDVPWYFADFLPTAAAIGDVRPPGNIDGVNVLPTLLGGVQPSLQSRFLYWETHDGGALAQAVRWGKWKALRFGINEPIELYNVVDDIAETQNVAADNADVVTRIEKYLESARTDSPYYPSDLSKRQNNRYDTLSGVVDPLPAPSTSVQGKAWKRHVIDDTSEGADGTRLADFNGDGLLDIATPWEEGGVVRIYPHPKKDKVRDPWIPVSVGAVKSPEDAVFHDLDGDGALEVISSAEGEEKSLFIHWSPFEPEKRLDGSAWQTVALPQSLGKQWMYVAPTQVDGKNGPDLVAAGKNDNAWIGWFQAPANPRNAGDWEWKPLRPVGWVMSIVNVDLDGDGDLDILYSDRKGPNKGVWWLEHPGAAGVEGDWPLHPVGGLNREAMFLDVGYLDADDGLDIAAAVRDGGVLLFSRQSPDKAWTDIEIPLPLDGGIAKSVSIADVDGDRHNDLVVSTVEAKNKHAIFWLDGAPGAHWAPTDISGLDGTKFDRVELTDVDGDGDLDAISSEEVEKLGVFWYENPRITASKAPEGPPFSPLVGQTLVPSDVDWEHPVYSTTFDDPTELSHWVLEGGKSATIENGHLVLESTPPIEGEKSDHLVFWLNEVFPADFLLEFSIRPRNRREGLAIVFFNARGINGKSIFDPALKPREGIFNQYHSSDLNNYHISYWAGDRGTANIRKNTGFNLVATGPDLVTRGAADAFQTVRVYKRGGTIRLIVDDVISAAWDDDGVKYGPVLTNDGWIGLRQMEHAIRCEYDHLKVYPLLP